MRWLQTLEMLLFSQAVLDLLVANLESEPGVAAERPTAMLFKRWVEGMWVVTMATYESNVPSLGCVAVEKEFWLLNPLNFQAASSFHSALLNFPVAGSGGVLATRRHQLQDLSPEELAAARAAEVREKKAAAQFLSTWVWKKKEPPFRTSLLIDYRGYTYYDILQYLVYWLG